MTSGLSETISETHSIPLLLTIRCLPGLILTHTRLMLPSTDPMRPLRFEPQAGVPLALAFLRIDHTWVRIIFYHSVLTHARHWAVCLSPCSVEILSTHALQPSGNQQELPSWKRFLSMQ